MHNLFSYKCNRLVCKNFIFLIFTFSLFVERIKRDEFCNVNPVDNGIAMKKEFPHIVVIEGKVLKPIGRFKILKIDSKCSGSLLTKRIVVTSQTCVDSRKHIAATIKFGMLVFNATEYVKSYEIAESGLMTENQLTILKLPEDVTENEFIMPIHMPKLSLDSLSIEKFLLAGWTGYRYECDQRMRKWFIQKSHFRSCGDNLICLDESNIVNYREVMLNQD